MVAGQDQYCHFHEDYGHDTNQCRELRPDRRSRKIKTIGSPGERNKEGKGEGLSHPTRSNSPHNLLLERTTMQQMSIGVSTIHRAIKFHTPRGIGIVFLTRDSYKTGEEQEKLKETSQEGTKDILSCVDAKERIVVNDKYLEQTIPIGKQLPTSTKMKLRGFLRANADVFAWTSAHMTGIPRTIMIGGKPFNTEHQLNEFKHIKTVKQKRRSLALERNEEIRIQVEELVKNNILQEVKYQTWVSNPVIVKKANKRWKLCVDFTDINKACPKDYHPLPITDQKIEDICKFCLKCFLDAYKGYHQIQMVKGDEEKTAFFTRERVFCYKRLPFGLKNTGATYHKLIDKVFGNQMGSNLELNPKKCSFGVEERLFLGHLITKQGIKANPSKERKVQFFPKTFEKFATKWKNRLWQQTQRTTEAEKAFRNMKEFIEALPMVTGPIKGETLLMYLTASEESISVMMLAEKGNKQVPMYFISRTLQGVKLEYLEMEKLILALVYAARRLRRYFQAHLIQILANFLAETPSVEDRRMKIKETKRKEPKPENTWKLFTDRASSSDGSGAGLMLVLFDSLGILPNDPQKVRKLRIKAPLYRMIDDKLYHRSYLSSWLRCVGSVQARSIIQEIHQGSCEMLAGPRIDIIRPLPIAPRGARFLVMAIDYFTKWVEAKPLVSKTGKHMGKFVWEHIMCIFEIPQIIISDNGKQFAKGNGKKTGEDSPRLGRRTTTGTYVLRLNNASKAEFQGKMRPTWEGPYIVNKAYGDGAYKLETLSGSSIDRTWNGSNLSKFYM
ncbi:reverse transcriptase domain-containing protein [Tanacetum coccineum]